MSQAGKYLTGSSTPLDTITGNVGGPITTDGSNNINIVGAGIIDVIGNPATHTLTITSSGVATLWVQQAVSLNPIITGVGYITTKNGLCDLTLPAIPLLGDTFKVTTGVLLANAWQISLNTGTLCIASQSSIVGVASTTVGDSVEIVCIVAGPNPVYRIIDFIGNISLL